MKHRPRNTRKNKERECDTLFSILIRLKGTLYTGEVQCYTCDKLIHFKEAQCGHFIPRQHMMTRWLEDNAKPQCKYCNENKRGNLIEYRKKLDLEFPGLAERLEELRNQTAKHSQSDLENLIIHLRTRIKECGGTKSIPNIY